MTRGILWSAFAGVWVLAIASTPAAAQNSAPSSPSQGPIVVDEVRDGFAIAPDIRVTDINHQTGVLVGAYGGWVIDNTLLIGGGGYGLTNTNTGMGYGGFVIGLMQHTDRPIGFGARALFGFGEGTVTAPYTTVLYPPPPVPTPFSHSVNPPQGQTVTYLASYHEHFFITDPSADVIIRLGPKVRIDAGIGYRLIAGYNYGYGYGYGYPSTSSLLQGVTGTFSVQIGGSSYLRR
jgi:hypothetical protein